MSNRVTVAVFFACLLLPITASTQESSTSATPGTDLRVRQIDDVEEYVRRTRFVLDRARAGDYGKIRRSNMGRLVESQQRIEALLGDRHGTIKLSLNEQVDLVNAQEVINAIIRADEKGRLVCKRSLAVGSRVPTTECLSVAERERQADFGGQLALAGNRWCSANGKCGE